MTLRIALVDDQEMYRLGFRMLLETQEEVEVVGEADDGRSALDLLARVKTDGVLMDVRMPGMNGIEATRRIVESGTDGPKVIVLTTFDLDEYAYEAIRAGAGGDGSLHYPATHGALHGPASDLRRWYARGSDIGEPDRARARGPRPARSRAVQRRHRPGTVGG